MKISELVPFLDAPVLEKIALKASINNNFEVVKFCIQKGLTNLDIVIMNFAFNKNLEAINFLIEKGCKNYNGVMHMAALVDDMYVVKLMIEKGATRFDDAMNMAKKNPKMWKFLKKQYDKQKKQP